MRSAWIVAGLLALLSGQARAANLDIYLGGGVGGTLVLDADANVNDAHGVLGQLGTAGRVTYDKATVSPAVVAGLGFNRYFAAEFRYAYLGNFELKARTSAGTAKESDDVHALSLAAVGKYPLGQKVQLLAKLGFGETIVGSACSIPAQGCGSATDSSLGFVFGGGIGLLPAKELELRFDYTQYQDVGDSSRNYTAGSFGLIETLAIYHF